MNVDRFLNLKKKIKKKRKKTTRDTQSCLYNKAQAEVDAITVNLRRKSSPRGNDAWHDCSKIPFWASFYAPKLLEYAYRSLHIQTICSVLSALTPIFHKGLAVPLTSHLNT